MSLFQKEGDDFKASGGMARWLRKVSLTEGLWVSVCS